MHHHETPDHDGWYWIQCGEDHDFMAYFRASGGLWQMDIFSSGDDGELTVSSFVQTAPGSWESISGIYGDSGPISESHWRGPLCWIGPLSSPFGPVASHIVEFGEDTHDEARRQGMAAIMVHVDYTGCGEQGGWTTKVGLLPRKEATMAVARAFR